ncbi:MULTISPECIES: ribonuclease domain-containing protein [Bacillus]|uniref:ribonuclease domain-containing protein n=1 Tax=Bacillus TaxID=1386 RepID=UPI002116FC31
MCGKSNYRKNTWVNREGNLHREAPGRTWYEADINYVSGYRGNDRIVYSSDGLVYKILDHYKTFTEIK